MKKQFLILMLAIQASCSYNHKKDVAEAPNNVALAEETPLSEGETYAHPVMFEDGDISRTDVSKLSPESVRKAVPQQAIGQFGLLLMKRMSSMKSEFWIPRSSATCIRCRKRTDQLTIW